MAMLDAFESSPVVLFGFSSEIIARRHREPIGKQIGKSQHEDYPGRKLCAGNSGDNGKRCYGSIDATVDPVAEIIVRGTTFQPPANGLRRMLVLHLFLL